MRIYSWVWLLSAIASFLSADLAHARTPLELVRSAISAPDNELNYEQAKLLFDRIISSDLDENAVTTEVDRLAIAASRIAADGTDVDKLKAVRQVIYDEGAWNGSRPFTYDHADPLGVDLNNKLLATYLDTRKGNCVLV